MECVERGEAWDGACIGTSPFGKTKIYFVFRSLNRTFAQKLERQ